MLFFGTFAYVLDDRHRVTVPPVFRDAFSEGMVIAPGLDACIVLHTRQQFEQEIEALQSLPTELQFVRNARRARFPKVVMDTPDKQGRISLDPEMMAGANISPRGEVVVVGTGNTLEVWDRSTWDNNEALRLADYQRAITEIGSMRSVQMGLGGAQ